MLQPRIRRPLASPGLSIDTLATALNALVLCHKHLPLRFSRPASHAAQGRANGPKDSAGRRLGAKKTASQPVIPGNIIYKQRGTKWFPGENCGIGKDHTIYAKTPGYVVYYRDPLRHPKRRYIGVALEKDGPGSTLPTPRNAPTRRRLGMYAAPIPQPVTPAVSVPLTGESESGSAVVVSGPILREGFAGNRIANVEIGRAAERSGVKVRPFDRKDRWLAWRKRSKKVRAKIAMRAAGGTKKTKGKKSNKKVVLP